jgi:hypothetical protein
MLLNYSSGHINKTESEFSEIVLHIHDKKSIEESLNQFLSKEKLSGDNRLINLLI